MKFHLYVTAALAAASLAACQPAPSPGASGANATTNSAATPATEAGLTTEAASTGEAPSTVEMRASPANCAVLASRDWRATNFNTTRFEVTGNVDLPTPTQMVTVVPDPNDAAGTTEARLILHISAPFEGAPPMVATMPVSYTSVGNETYTRVHIVCGDGIIATIPITRIAR
jgi:hypothetical protein